MQINSLPRPAALPSRTRRESANAAISAAIAQVQQEVPRLIEEGHVIVGIDISCGRPTIQLMASARLGAMAEAGDAAYWMCGYDTMGYYRKGQLIRRACRVIWIERGH